RIIDHRLRSAGHEPSSTLESDSVIVLFAHVRTGRWSSVLPARLVDALGLTETVRAIPITGGAEPHPAVGLVVPHGEPMTPLTAAMVTEARRLASVLGDIEVQSAVPTAPTPAR